METTVNNTFPRKVLIDGMTLREFVDHVYNECFKKDWIDIENWLSYNQVNIEVVFGDFNNKIINMKERMYWHLICGDNVDCKYENAKEDRCSYIPWIKAFIDLFGICKKVVWYIPQGYNDNRIRIFDENFEYIVVIIPKITQAILITAYPIKERKKINMKKEFEEYWKSKAYQPRGSHGEGTPTTTW